MDDKKSEVAPELLLKISKEIAIKFIEVGRITPANFAETFTTIHQSVRKTAEK